MFSACGPKGETASVLKSDLAPQFPLNPIDELTPGDVCESERNRRYPERIPYCSRNVSSSKKRRVIAIYDREYGFHVGDMNRRDFKVDHYISLCMGGSNQISNLWPQHRSVYELTDPLEGKLCRLMAQGKMKQADAIETLKYAKNNLEEAQEVEDELDDMLNGN